MITNSHVEIYSVETEINTTQTLLLHYTPLPRHYIRLFHIHTHLPHYIRCAPVSPVEEALLLELANVCIEC